MSRLPRIKIFDEDVQKYLHSLGISDDAIKRIQFEELKKVVAARLNLLAKMIEKDQYDRVKKYLESADVDGVDCEYISFADLVGGSANGSLGEMLSLLKQLKGEK